MSHTKSLHPISVRSQEDLGLSYLLLYIPALLAWGFASDPLFSFGVGWMGSWWILGLSMTGRIRSLPEDHSWDKQLLRPLFLSQVMFFGLFCLGPIFYMWDLAATGSFLQSMADEIQRTAAAQRYYVLGHAAFVHGIVVLMDYRRSGEWSFQLRTSKSTFFFCVAAGALTFLYLFQLVPALNQFEVKFRYATAVASILGFAYALREGNYPAVLVGVIVYGYIFTNSLLSGWKSQVIIVVGLFLVVMYPKYKKVVGVASVIAVVLFATLLPAYNTVFRQLNWQDRVDAEQAAQIAYQRIRSGNVNVENASWAFLRDRLSTVSLFTDYIESTPSQNPYYGLSTVEQAVYSIIPRALWNEKPNTEKLVMNRVYENTDIQPEVEVSAKPLIITDGYLAGGHIGVFLSCFFLGCFASIASRYAERWFGGYAIGGQLIFTALFARVLFVASFEFLFNALFWSFVLMVLLAYGGRASGLLRWNPPGKASSLHERSLAAKPS
jgi:hypothetical protein